MNRYIYHLCDTELMYELTFVDKLQFKYNQNGELDVIIYKPGIQTGCRESPGPQAGEGTWSGAH